MSIRPILTYLFLFTTIAFTQQKDEPDQLTQVSTIDALLGGIFDGEVTIEKLLQQGNFGLGTFNTLDGEMIVVDGVCYQIKSDGKTSTPLPSIKTPFAAVTSFETDLKATFAGPLSLEQLQTKIDSLLPTKNMIYAIKINGKFISATARSVPSQKPPYKKLTEITKTQPVFSFTNRKGILVGFRCPSYVKGLNVPGYHLHILTDDKKEGGHLLSMNADSLTVEIDQTDNYKLILPHDEFFAKADFNVDKEADLKKAEK